MRKMLNHEDCIWLHRNKESWSGLHRVVRFVFAGSNPCFNMFSTFITIITRELNSVNLVLLI